jgi:hypothetical protein
MNITNLPPLPPEGARGSDVCAIMRLYLAVWNDLPREEMLQVSKHLETCASCAREHRILSRATSLVAGLEASSPSARVDQAVLAAIAAHSGSSKSASIKQRAPEPLRRPVRRRRTAALVSSLAAAAVLAIALLASAQFVLPGGIGSVFHNKSGVPPAIATQQAFALPANLSWDSYVLYLHQTAWTAKGEQYTITTYHDMTSGMTNAETVMDNKLDVDVVRDQHDALGMDMMHHVAQWGAQKWSVDVSMFDLNSLRTALKDKQAVYDGTEIFHGQKVYRIRFKNGMVLLLNMHYMPVNVQNSSGQTLYDSVQWLSPSKVPNSMWDMNVPSGFKMGKLPAKPQ